MSDARPFWHPGNHCRNHHCHCRKPQDVALKAISRIVTEPLTASVIVVWWHQCLATSLPLEIPCVTRQYIVEMVEAPIEPQICGQFAYIVYIYTYSPIHMHIFPLLPGGHLKLSLSLRQIYSHWCSAEIISYIIYIIFVWFFFSSFFGKPE